MLLITCPWCGPRTQTEFTYEDDATLQRPHMDNMDAQAHYEYVYLRDPRLGMQDELWRHGAGCGKFVKVRRDTLSHEIITTGAPSDTLDGGGE